MLSFFSSVVDNFKKNKFSLFTIGFSTVTFLKDIEEMITHFLDNIKYFFSAIIFICLIFLIDFMYNKLKPVNERKYNLGQLFKLNKAFLKIGGLFCLFILTFSFLTFIYIKNHPIYYVKLTTFKNPKEAVVYKDSINYLFKNNQGKKLKARILTRSSNIHKYEDGNYMVALNGGFISEQKAKEIIILAKNTLGSTIKLEVSNPTTNISVFKKINYLINNR